MLTLVLWGLMLVVVFGVVVPIITAVWPRMKLAAPAAAAVLAVLLLLLFFLDLTPKFD